MDIKLWDIIKIVIIIEIVRCFLPIALITALTSPGLIILICIAYFLIKKIRYRNYKKSNGDDQTEADIQDLDNEMCEVETILDQMQKVEHINDELDEIEAVLDQFNGAGKTDRKVIPMWDLPKKP